MLLDLTKEEIEFIRDRLNDVPRRKLFPGWQEADRSAMIKLTKALDNHDLNGLGIGDARMSTAEILEREG